MNLLKIVGHSTLFFFPNFGFPTKIGVTICCKLRKEIELLFLKIILVQGSSLNSDDIYLLNINGNLTTLIILDYLFHVMLCNRLRIYYWIYENTVDCLNQLN